MAGLEIEKGGIDWTDKETIRDLSMQYARAVLQPKVETKETQGTARQPAPSDTKTCPAYQKGTCEHDKDHPPLTHACNYCHKTKALLCRHADSSCFRKINDSKNEKLREL